MKHFIVIVLSVLALGCKENLKYTASASYDSSSQLVEELLALSEDKNYFKLQTKFTLKKEELSKEHIHFFDAILFNVFNNPTASNKAISKIINSNKKTLADSLLKTLYAKKINNHQRLYEYNEVAKTVTEMRSRFKSSLDSVEDSNFKNTYNLYHPLKSITKQEIIIPSDITIQMERDVANLLNIETIFSDNKINMVFDTGANISVIRKSYVDKLGMRLIESDFSVGSATDIKVKSQMAIAEEFKIGEMTIKNALFMVLNDDDLSFPQVPGGYDIYGIIGFPIIEAMREIHFTKENQLFIPKEPTEYMLNNFAIDGLIPIIKTTYKEDVLTFGLDTGAETTSLFYPFYKKYKIDIDENNEKEKFGVGSAGGTQVYEGYKINDINLKIADSSAVLNKIEVHIEKIKQDKVELYGNIGQDYITQFNKMILSFEHSSIVFE